MKCLSLRNPWPYAIFHLEKDFENRPWSSNHRGPLLIHTSKTWDQRGYEFLTGQFMDEWVPSKDHHVFGAIVGRVEVIDCLDDADSRWFYGPFGLELANPVEFKKPIPWRGQLGLFDVPANVIKE